MDKIIEDWKQHAREEYNKHFDFLSQQRSTADRISEVQKLHNEAFEKVDCLACANCCKTTPALITRSDAKRIAKYLKIPPKTFLRKYTIEDINGEYVTQNIPCTFLQPDNTCSIYEVRPEACRRFPHTDEPEYFRRTKLNANNTIVCPAAYHVVRSLHRQHEKNNS